MKILIALISIFVFSASAYANIFVGNGGDGLLFNGKLYLRDLVSAGVEKNPDMGTEIDPELPSLPDRTILPFDYPEKLLAMKLTEINKAYPSFGDYLLATMKVYTWTLQDLPLTPIIDKQDRVKLSPDTTPVQIANRFQTSIRISASAWAQLDDSNKVALLIHEAVYSLVSVAKMSGGSGYQSSFTAREITGSLFTASYLKKNTELLHDSISAILNIPKVQVSLEDIRRHPQWVILTEGFSGRIDAGGHTPEDFADSMGKVCAKVQNLSKRGAANIMVMRWGRWAEPLVEHYTTSSGADPQDQAYVTIAPRDSKHGKIRYFSSSNIQKCTVLLGSERGEFDRDSIWQ